MTNLNKIMKENKGIGEVTNFASQLMQELLIDSAKTGKSPEELLRELINKTSI